MEDTSTLRKTVLASYIAGIKAIAGDAKLGYLSTQMTSGANMNRAAHQHGYATTADFKNDPAMVGEVAKVMAENIRFSNGTLAKVRELTDMFIITPTTLDVPDFTQDDYAWFWREIMFTLKPDIFVSPEWEFSRGSRFEILDGFEAGVKVWSVEPWHHEMTEAQVRRRIEEVDASGAKW